MKGGVELDAPMKRGVNKGVAVLDFILRLSAFVATLGAAIAMATTNETLPFFTQFLRFRAEYDDLPSFTYAFTDLHIKSFIAVKHQC